MISEFGENTNSYCSFESKETALLHSENGNLQQRVNVLTHEVRGGMRTRGGQTEGGWGTWRIHFIIYSLDTKTLSHQKVLSSAEIPPCFRIN